MDGKENPMGWGRMLLLGDWGQQMDIEDQRREIETLQRQVRAGSAGRAAGDVSPRLAQLEKENDELRLYLASLVRYLGSKGILRRDEFAALVETVDAEDGSADGGYEGEIVT
jgi:hypothetical protein